MAKSDTLFKSAGICTHTKGAVSVTKVRYGTDYVRRVKLLNTPGNVKVKGLGLDPVRVDFVELPQGMNKFQALEFLLTQTVFQNPDDQALIQDEMLDREPKSSKPLRTVKVKVAAKAAPSLSNIRARAKKPVPTVEDVLDAFSSTADTELAQ